MTAKSISIKGTKRKSGGRALKVIELIAGGLSVRSGALPGLGGPQGTSTDSAEVSRGRSTRQVSPLDVEAREGPNGNGVGK